MHLNETALNAAMEAGLPYRFEGKFKIYEPALANLKMWNREEYEAAFTAYFEALEKQKQRTLAE